MGLRVTSTKMCFFYGRRYRPGVAFNLPDGVKPSADMTVVESAAAPEQKKQRIKGESPKTLSDITQADAQALGDSLA